MKNNRYEHFIESEEASRVCWNDEDKMSTLLRKEKRKKTTTTQIHYSINYRFISTKLDMRGCDFLTTKFSS
jgi:hypothetical protein